jgi:hypothetical protein
VDATTSDATIVAYIGFTNVAVGGPDNDVFVAPLVGQSLEKEQQEANKGKISTYVKSAADIGMMVTSIPILQRFRPIAAGASIIGGLLEKFGLSRPISTNPICEFVNRGYPQLAVTDTNIASDPLMMKSDNHVAVDPRLFGDKLDYMEIKNYVALPSYFETIVVDSSTAAGEVLGRYRVTPTICGVTDIGTHVQSNMSYSAHIAQYFTYWNGSMNFLIWYELGLLESMTVGVAWVPHRKSIPTTIGPEMADLIGKTYDISGTGVIQFSIPYFNSEDYGISIPYDLVADTAKLSGAKEFSCSGTVILYAISVLSTSGDSSNALGYMNVFTGAGQDMKFAKPRSPWNSYVVYADTPAFKAEEKLKKNSKNNNNNPFVEKKKNKLKGQTLTVYTGEDLSIDMGGEVTLFHYDSDDENMYGGFEELIDIPGPVVYNTMEYECTPLFDYLVGQSSTVITSDEAVIPGVNYNCIRELFQMTPFRPLVEANIVEKKGLEHGEEVTHLRELLSRYMFNASIVPDATPFGKYTQAEIVRDDTLTNKYFDRLISGFKYHRGGFNFMISCSDNTQDFQVTATIFPKTNFPAYDGNFIDQTDLTEDFYGSVEGQSIWYPVFRPALSFSIPFYNNTALVDNFRNTSVNTEYLSVYTLKFVNFGVTWPDFVERKCCAPTFGAFYPIPPPQTRVETP